MPILKTLRAFILPLTALLALSSQAIPPWVDGGMSLIDAQIARTRSILSTPAARLDHQPELVAEMDQVLKHVHAFTAQISDTDLAPLEALQKRLADLNDAGEYSWDIHSLFSLGLASLGDELDPAIQRAPYADSIIKGIELVTQSPQTVGLRALVAQNSSFGDNMALAPIFCEDPSHALLGVRTLLKAFTHGIAPVIITPGDVSVHGGAIKTAAGFSLHDALHGLYYKLCILDNPLLAPLMPAIRDRLDHIPVDTHEGQMELVRLILSLHEWSANQILYTDVSAPADPHPDPLTYNTQGIQTMQSVLSRTADDYHLRLLHAQIEAERALPQDAIDALDDIALWQKMKEVPYTIRTVTPGEAYQLKFDDVETEQPILALTTIEDGVVHLDTFYPYLGKGGVCRSTDVAQEMAKRNFWDYAALLQHVGYYGAGLPKPEDFSQAHYGELLTTVTKIMEGFNLANYMKARDALSAQSAP